MDRIVLFLPNWIGDVVMATPAIRAVRDRFPKAKLFAVCKPYVSATIEGTSWFDELILHDKNGPSDRRSLGVAGKLRRERIDAAVLFPNSFRSALIAWLGGCRRRIGFARYGRSILLTDRFHALKDERGRFKPAPIIDDYNHLVRRLGIDDPGYRMELGTTPKDEADVDRIWSEERFDRLPEVIGFNSGGAFGAAKHWPIDSFAKLAQQFVDQRGSGVLVLCGPNERDLAQQIVEKANRPVVVSLAKRDVSLGLTKASIRRLDLLITTDSGPRHFAAAFNRPVITLFGPTFIEWTETYYSKAINLQKTVPCGPCQKRVCPLDHRCMRDLTVADVWQAASRLMGGSRRVG